MGSRDPSGRIDEAEGTGVEAPDGAVRPGGDTGPDAAWLDSRIRDLYLADAGRAPSPRLAALMRQLDDRAAGAEPEPPQAAPATTPR